MTERAPYSRTYWTIRNDERLATIYPDDRLLAAWLRLLIAADMAWPAAADIPAAIRPASLRALADAGVIVTAGLPSGLFRFHGLDEERGRRRLAASRLRNGQDPDGTPLPSRLPPDWVPDGTQTGPGRDPDGTQSSRESRAVAEPSRAEPSRAEQNARENDPWADPEHEVIAWLSRHGCDVRPGNGYHRKLVTAVEVHGANALIGMMDRLAEAGTKQGDIKGFLFGAIDALDKRSRPSLAALEKDDRADDERRSFEARLERTRAAAASMREAASPLSASLVDAMRVEGGFAARLAKEEAT